MIPGLNPTVETVILVLTGAVLVIIGEWPNLLPRETATKLSALGGAMIGKAVLQRPGDTSKADLEKLADAQK